MIGMMKLKIDPSSCIIFVASFDKTKYMFDKRICEFWIIPEKNCVTYKWIITFLVL